MSNNVSLMRSLSAYRSKLLTTHHAPFNVAFTCDFTCWVRSRWDTQKQEQYARALRSLQVSYSTYRGKHQSRSGSAIAATLLALLAHPEITGNPASEIEVSVRDGARAWIPLHKTPFGNQVFGDEGAYSENSHSGWRSDSEGGRGEISLATISALSYQGWYACSTSVEPKWVALPESEEGRQGGLLRWNTAELCGRCAFPFHDQLSA